METKQELLDELSKIDKWESNQKGLWIWERVGRLPFKLLDKVTPKFVHEKIGILLDELGSYIHNGGKYLTNEKKLFKDIEKKIGKEINSFHDIEAISLQEMEQLSVQMTERSVSVATLQGAMTGVGGIFTLAIDIPALLGQSLKILQDISTIHGFNPNDKQERVFIVKCLQFSSADIVGKKSILNELSYFDDESKSAEMMSQLQGWREVVTTYRDQFGWKKFFQMIPIAGMIFGAYTNRSAINDVAEIGTMLYRKRRILNRLSKAQIKNDQDLSL